MIFSELFFICKEKLKESGGGAGDIGFGGRGVDGDAGLSGVDENMRKIKLKTKDQQPQQNTDGEMMEVVGKKKRGRKRTGGDDDPL